MQKIIHHLRRQPEAVKRHILNVATIILGIILLVLWIFSLSRGLSNSDSQAKMSNDLKPLNALKANIVDGFNNISQPHLNTESQ